MRTLIVASLAMSIALPDVAESRNITHTYMTSYCLSGTMADGTQVRSRSVASNFLPMGARIRLVGRSFFGMRRFVVRDTGGALFDGHLDAWSSSCSRSFSWGRRAVAFKMGWGR